MCIRDRPGGLLVLGHGELGSFDEHDLVKVDNKNCLAFIKSECYLNDDEKKYKNQNNKRKSLSRMELS